MMLQQKELHVQNLILVQQPVRHWYANNSKEVHDMKTKELDFHGCGKPQPLQMSWTCWANRLLSRTLEQMSCCVLCQVARCNRLMAVECSVCCCRTDVHTVCISGIYFFSCCWTNSRLAAWTQCLFVLKHAVSTLGFTTDDSVFSKRNPVHPLQDCFMICSQ